MEDEERVEQIYILAPSCSTVIKDKGMIREQATLSFLDFLPVI